MTDGHFKRQCKPVTDDRLDVVHDGRPSGRIVLFIVWKTLKV